MMSKINMYLNIMNIFACIVNIQVPHDVKNQHALALKRTSQIMINGQHVIISIGNGTRCSG